MAGIVIYSVGSPLVADVEESLARAGVQVTTAIRNFEGESFIINQSVQCELSEINSEIKSLPIIVPLFTPANRQKASSEAFRNGFLSAYSLIDSSVTVPKSMKSSQGLFINVGCSLGASCVFEEFVFLNRGVSLGHHTHLSRFVSVGPGAVISGLVDVGKGALIGAGAVILPKVKVGDNAIIGAGSVVTKDVPENCIVLGNPARIVRDRLSDSDVRLVE